MRSIHDGDKAQTKEFIDFFEENADGYVAVTEWLRALRLMKMSKGKGALKDALLSTEILTLTLNPTLMEGLATLH